MFGFKNNAFGMVMSDRSFSNEKYRWGFNGKETDNEVKGNGNSLDFGARIYDSRLGRWLSVDPVSYTHLDVYKRQILSSIITILLIHKNRLINSKRTPGWEPVQRLLFTTRMP